MPKLRKNASSCEILRELERLELVLSQLSEIEAERDAAVEASSGTVGLLRHQPGSALSSWFRERVGQTKGRVRRIAVVALARRLLVALWRYVEAGVMPEGAEIKATVTGQ